MSGVAVVPKNPPAEIWLAIMVQPHIRPPIKSSEPEVIKSMERGSEQSCMTEENKHTLVQNNIYNDLLSGGNLGSTDCFG